MEFTLREPIGSSTYPMPDAPINMDETLKALATECEPNNRTASLYLHIPFCDQLCSFCGFNKFVSSEDIKEKYVAALMKEIQMYGQLRHVDTTKVEAVYIGGGTPNSLSATQLSEILMAVRANFPLSQDCEITCEGTPQNFTEDRIAALKNNGVRRVSAGIQTFEQDIRMAHLHMTNSKEDLLGFIDLIRRNFDSFNLDMIYNLPNQTDAIWQDDLETAINSGSTHLTLYPLVLLEKTAFYTDYVLNNKHAPPEQEREIKLFEWSVDRMGKSPYTNPYTVRDWSRPGFECRYIRLNAECNQIIALGAGAHGFLAGMTYRNLKAPAQYIDAINNDFLPLEGQKFCSKAQLIQRYMVMGLRLNALDMKPFEARFGQTWQSVFANEIEKLQASGYLNVDRDVITFTAKGQVWGNNIRTFFESEKGRSVGYTDTLAIGVTGKDHYSAISRIKASGDVEAHR